MRANRLTSSLGYDTVEGYEQGKSTLGAPSVGTGNRIARGEFTLGGTAFHLPKNDGPNNLHGGTVGFNKEFGRAWIVRARMRGSELSYTSADGEEGYPAP